MPIYSITMAYTRDTRDLSFWFPCTCTPAVPTPMPTPKPTPSTERVAS